MRGESKSGIRKERMMEEVNGNWEGVGGKIRKEVKSERASRERDKRRKNL